MNVELLDKIKAHLLEDPRRAHMEAWLAHKKVTTYMGKVKWEWFGVAEPSCGTVGCIAGWACELSGITFSPNNARELLGISVEQSRDLFYVENWPYQLRSYIRRYDPGSPKYAHAIISMIDYFKKQEGAI